MRTDTGQVFRLEDYRPSPYFIPETDLTFRLSPEATIVIAKLTVERRDGTPLDARAGARRRRAATEAPGDRRRCRQARRVHGIAGWPRHRQAAEGTPLPADHRDRTRAGEKRGADGPLPLGRQSIARNARPKASAASPISSTARTSFPSTPSASRPTPRRRRCCCPTATRSHPASCRAAAISPSGTIRSRSRPICLRWWPATSAR